MNQELNLSKKHVQEHVKLQLVDIQVQVKLNQLLILFVLLVVPQLSVQYLFEQRHIGHGRARDLMV